MSVAVPLKASFAKVVGVTGADNASKWFLAYWASSCGTVSAVVAKTMSPGSASVVCQLCTNVAVNVVVSVHGVRCEDCRTEAFWGWYGRWLDWW